MLVDFIIVGQGIAGTMLSLALMQRGASVVVMDEKRKFPGSSSMAGGLIHPYRGKTFQYDERYAFFVNHAVDTYQQLSTQFGSNFIQPMNLLLWGEHQGLEEIQPEKWNQIHSQFHTNTPPNLIPAHRVNGRSLLEFIHEYGIQQGWLHEVELDPNNLEFIHDKVHYDTISARTIILCDGAYGINKKWFPTLPFIHNRGDVLIIDAPELNTNFSYQIGVRLIPMHDGRWWVGGNQSWELNDMKPDMKWREFALSNINHSFRGKVDVVEHVVRQRPASAGQFPFMIKHSQLPVAIFNGFGSRGFTYTPFYAAQMADYLLGKKNVIDNYDMNRMIRLLQ